MKFLLFVLIMWICMIGLLVQFGRIWWTAMRTGRWLLSSGRSYYFPSKSYTFSIYDRTNNPGMYRLAVNILPIFVSGWLLVCVLLTTLFVRQAHTLF
jgi:hypothetical protein